MTPETRKALNLSTLAIKERREVRGRPFNEFNANLQLATEGEVYFQQEGYHLHDSNSDDLLECKVCKRALGPTDFYLFGCASIEALDGRSYVQRHVRHPICDSCRDETVLLAQMSSPQILHDMQNLAYRFQMGARKRDILWLLHPTDLVGRWVQQEGRCGLTGAPFSHKLGGAVSIDRIVNERAYTLRNIELVCGAVNMMKGSYSRHEFVSWCKKVAKCQNKS